MRATPSAEELEPPDEALTPPAEFDGPGVDDEGAPHREAADQVVEAVGEQEQVPERTMPGVLRAVAVMPMEELLQHEEHQEPGDQPRVDGDPVPERIHGLGQHVKEGPPSKEPAASPTIGSRSRSRVGRGKSTATAPTRASALMARPASRIHPNVDIVTRAVHHGPAPIDGERPGRREASWNRPIVHSWAPRHCAVE